MSVTTTESEIPLLTEAQNAVLTAFAAAPASATIGDEVAHGPGRFNVFNGGVRIGTFEAAAPTVLRLERMNLLAPARAFRHYRLTNAGLVAAGLATCAHVEHAEHRLLDASCVVDCATCGEPLVDVSGEYVTIARSTEIG